MTDTTKLIPLLQKTALFHDMNDGDIQSMLPHFRQMQLQAGDILIEGNTVGNSMYIVLEGTLEVVMPSGDILNTIGAGEIVGELALLTEQQRIATVKAISDTRLIECTRQDLEQILEQHPAVVERFSDVVLPRIRSFYLMEVLKTLIGGITYQELEQLQNRIEWIHLKQGDMLFGTGSQMREMYIVVKGRLRVLSPDDHRTTVGEVGVGETVGELSLLSDAPHTATVTAIRESHLVRIDEGDYLWLAENHPTISTSIASTIVKRQQAMLNRAKVRRAPHMTFAIVPLNPDVPIDQFIAQLKDHLASLGETRSFNSQEFDQHYGYEQASSLPTDHPISMMLAGWMDELERDYHYILYESASELTTWTQRCIEHADRILLVANATDSSEQSPIEKSIQFQYPQVRTELILLHPEQTETPSGTAQWLDKRQVFTHHHIRQGDDNHYRRTARRLTGHATGLVLSGGGARGFAHLGVIRALQEEQVTIDVVAGTSMGSLLAAGVALNGDFKEIMEVAAQFSNSRSIFDYTFPMVAIMKSAKVTRLLHNIYGDVNIEDMWIPFFCIASNLSTAEVIINTRGKLHQALRASMSIPGVFSPVIRDGDIIIDGGIMNNFPIDIMQEWVEGGTVIGLTAQSDHTKSKRPAFEIDDHVSGWKVLFNRLNPFSKTVRVPLLPITFLKTLEINTLERQRTYQHCADLILNTDVRDYGLMAFDKYESITQTGYDHALPNIKAWIKTQPDFISQKPTDGDASQ